MIDQTETAGSVNPWTPVLMGLLSILLVPAALAAAPGDLVIPRKEGADMSVELMPASDFPHWVHRVRYRCDACHDRLFEMKLGATEITMDQMNQDLSCGACHNGKIAFDVSFDNCTRCHAGKEE